MTLEHPLLIGAALGLVRFPDPYTRISATGTAGGVGMILLVVGFALATERGRRTLRAVDPLYALLVIIVLALPYLVWLVRADVLALPALPALADLKARALRWGVVLGGLIVATAAIGLTLTLIHLISIPISNTSVNPARSTAVAFFQDGAAGQLWAFWVAPIVGAAIAGATIRAIAGRAIPAAHSSTVP